MLGFREFFAVFVWLFEVPLGWFGVRLRPDYDTPARLGDVSSRVTPRRRIAPVDQDLPDDPPAVVFDDADPLGDPAGLASVEAAEPSPPMEVVIGPDSVEVVPAAPPAHGSRSDLPAPAAPELWEDEDLFGTSGAPARDNDLPLAVSAAPEAIETAEDDASTHDAEEIQSLDFGTAEVVPVFSPFDPFAIQPLELAVADAPSVEPEVESVPLVVVDEAPVAPEVESVPLVVVDEAPVAPEVESPPLVVFEDVPVVDEAPVEPEVEVPPPVDVEPDFDPSPVEESSPVEEPSPVEPERVRPRFTGERTLDLTDMGDLTDTTVPRASVPTMQLRFDEAAERPLDRDDGIVPVTDVPPDVAALADEARRFAVSARVLAVQAQAVEEGLAELLQADPSLTPAVLPSLKRVRFAAGWVHKAAQRANDAAARARVARSADVARAAVEEADKALADTRAASRRVGKEDRRARRGLPGEVPSPADP